MARTFARARLAALAALPLALLANASALGQDPALEVFYTRLEPKESFKYKWKGKEDVCTAGVFRWEVPLPDQNGNGSFGTNGLDRSFTGYCAEVLVPITAENTYRFRPNNIYAPSNYGLKSDEAGIAAATKRTDAIRELFGRYYRDPIGKPVNPTEAVALQVALWEIIQETEPADAPAKRDLFAGDFQANYPRAAAPAFVLKAQEYLDSLTGNDALFEQNEDLKGRELIRLMGIENAAGVVAQSQYALRMTAGGIGGGNLGVSATGGGGAVAPVGGIGAPVGGVGGVGGGSGGGGFLSNGGGNPGTSSTTTPTGSTTTTTTPPPVTTSTTPVGGPSTGPIPTPFSSSDPGGGPGVTPRSGDDPGIDPRSVDPTPVPAPAGLLLA